MKCHAVANSPSQNYHYYGYDCTQKDEASKDGSRYDSIKTVLGACERVLRSHWGLERVGENVAPMVALVVLLLLVAVMMWIVCINIRESSIDRHCGHQGWI